LIRLVALASLLLAAPALAATPSGQRAVVALIVTNNRSAELGRPDLRYADDDGAKYYELFRMMAPEDQVALLTDFDSDTARLFPELTAVAKTPSRANVERAAELLARKVDALGAQGATTDFYFIYAGHGDIDRGRGFVELTDSAMNADDLEALLLRRVHAAHMHVILDSCNSFFVLNPRKPGGRRFPTPKDAAAELAAKFPNLGVFLSTSAEAQVYEWSELQAGIFSHAVRSGLMGAADANGDGRVSYTELAAFVDVAARDVRNPLYRPTVFARGPGGQNDTAVVDLTNRRAAILELPAGDEQRLTVRDADDLPWIDLHVEANTRVQLHLPERIGQRVVVQSRALDGAEGAIARRRGAIAAGQATVLAQLSPEEERGEARGVGELFRALFSAPFGPRALAAYLAAGADAAPAIGIAQEDVARMRLLLRHTAEIDRARRLTMAATGYGLSAVGLGLGSWLVATGPDVHTQPLQWGLGTGLLAGAGISLIVATVHTLRRSKAESILAEFESRFSAAGSDRARVVAQTEQQLFRLYDDEHKDRRLSFVFGWVLAGVGSLGLGLTAIPALSRSTTVDLLRVGFALATAGGVAAGVQASFETPIERMVKLWSEDPGIQRLPRLGVTATTRGASLALSGSF
jgi:hypothetical protein